MNNVEWKFDNNDITPQSTWTEQVRVHLAELAGAQAAEWVEDTVEGFADWWSDRLSPAEAAEAALVDATGLDDIQLAVASAREEAVIRP